MIEKVFFIVVGVLLGIFGTCYAALAWALYRVHFPFPRNTRKRK